MLHALPSPLLEGERVPESALQITNIIAATEPMTRAVVIAGVNPAVLSHLSFH